MIQEDVVWDNRYKGFFGARTGLEYDDRGYVLETNENFRILENIKRDIAYGNSTASEVRNSLPARYVDKNITRPFNPNDGYNTQNFSASNKTDRFSSPEPERRDYQRVEENKPQAQVKKKNLIRKPVNDIRHNILLPPVFKEKEITLPITGDDSIDIEYYKIEIVRKEESEMNLEEHKKYLDVEKIQQNKTNFAVEIINKSLEDESDLVLLNPDIDVLIDSIIGLKIDEYNSNKEILTIGEVYSVTSGTCKNFNADRVMRLISENNTILGFHNSFNEFLYNNKENKLMKHALDKLNKSVTSLVNVYLRAFSGTKLTIDSFKDSFRNLITGIEKIPDTVLRNNLNRGLENLYDKLRISCNEFTIKKLTEDYTSNLILPVKELIVINHNEFITYEISNMELSKTYLVNRDYTPELFNAIKTIDRECTLSKYVKLYFYNFDKVISIVKISDDNFAVFEEK